MNNIEVLISKALIDSVTCHDEFILNNVLKEYNGKKEEVQNLRTKSRLSKILFYLQNSVTELLEA